MRSLFFKIFAWFWLGHVIVVGMLIATMGPPRDPKPDQFRAWTGDMVTLYGRQALDAYGQTGAPGARAYTRQLHERTGVRVFLLDDRGNELVGQALPQGAAEASARAVGARATELDSSWGRGILVAVPASGQNGGARVFVGQLPGPPSFFLASASRTLLRGTAALGLAGILCYGLAHYLTAPLRNLRASARSLAGGNLGTRVSPAVQARHDEIGDLGQDFNFMAERIESLISAQQRLILDVSHELRSPLARLNLALGLAVQRAGPAADSALERIGREAERLNGLIERMLLLARLENREAAGELIRINLAGMLRDIVADAQFEAEGLGRSVVVTRCEECEVQGIPHLLRSAIDNVVRNALRYTGDGTRVEVSLEREESGQAIVRVRDRGPGVPEESLERIFRPFCRVGEDRSAKTGGVGLGLAIAREALRIHGGTIRAANAPDGGLAVEMTLTSESPISIPAATGEADAERADQM